MPSARREVIVVVLLVLAAIRTPASENLPSLAFPLVPTLPVIENGPTVAAPTSSTTPRTVLATSTTGNDPSIKDLTPAGFGSDIRASVEGNSKHDTPGDLYPAPAGTGGFYFSAETLLFRPRRGDFDFALLSSSANVATSGPLETLNYHLRAGIRTDLGYRFGDSGWEIQGEYTYFHSSANRSVYAGPGQVIFPTLTRPGLTDSVDSATANANLGYNIYDLNIGKRFAVDEHLSLRMYGGIRFASIHQDMTANYDGLDANQAQVSAKTSFEGFGPIIGTEATLGGWHGFHLYGRVSGGLLTGQNGNPLYETNNAGQTVYTNTSYDVRKVVPTASIGIGGGWEYKNFSIRAGYEIHNWFGLINQPRFTDDVTQGKLVTRSSDLSLEGLFFQVGMKF